MSCQFALADKQWKPVPGETCNERIFFQCQATGCWTEILSCCEQVFGSIQGVDTSATGEEFKVCGSHMRGCEGELYSKDLRGMPGRYPSQFGFRTGTQVALFSKSLRME